MCVGPGFDSPVPPFSRILILVVGLIMPIGNVICPKNIHDFVGNLSFGIITEEFVNGSLPPNVILKGVDKLLPTFHRVSRSLSKVFQGEKGTEGHLCTPWAWSSHQWCRSSVCHQLGQIYHLVSFEPLNLSRGVDGVSFSITSILIDNQVNYAIVSFYKGSTFDSIKALEFMTVYASYSASSRGSGWNPCIRSSKTTISSSIY